MPKLLRRSTRYANSKILCKEIFEKNKPIEEIYIKSEIKDETNKNYLSDENGYEAKSENKTSVPETNNNCETINDVEASDTNQRIESTNNFECKLCKESFETRHALRKHTNSHDEKEYECRLCPFSTDDSETLRHHILQLHVTNSEKEGKSSGDNMYDELEQVIERKILRKVIMEDGVSLGRQRKMKYACSQCNKLYSDKAVLETHVMCHTLEKPFNCDMCDYKCRYKESMTRHMTCFHLIIQSKEPRPKNSKKREDSDSSDDMVKEDVGVGGKKKRKLTRKFECAICGVTSSHKRELMDHIKEKHPNAHFESMEGNDGEKVHQITTASKPAKPTNKLTIKCEFCSIVFHDKWKYNVHRRKHTGVKPFICSECDFKATSKMTVRDHIHRKHSDATQAKIYLRTVGIDGEVEEVALAVPWREFKCEFCGEDLKDNYSLKMHKNKKHGKAMPFTCLKCQHKELQKAKMIMHCKKTHSNITNLDTMIVKNGKPVKVGSGNLPACEICNKEFTYKSQVNHHMLSHTGEKLFQCVHCCFQTNQKKILSVHLKNYHKVEND